MDKTDYNLFLDFLFILCEIEFYFLKKGEKFEWREFKFL
jgi:hypothetical protein